MPKCKLSDTPDTKHGRTNECKVEDSTGSSLKRKFKKKKKKGKHHHHKRKHLEKHKSKTKTLVSLLPELLHPGPSSDSDVCIIYESQKKETKYHSNFFESPAGKKEKRGIGNSSQLKNFIDVETRVCEENGNVVNTEELLTKCEVSKQCSLASQPEVIFISDEERNSWSDLEIIPLEDDVTSGPKCVQAVSASSGAQADNKRELNNRKWRSTPFGRTMPDKTEGSESNGKEHMMFTVLSYNVLCQEILEEHMNLYTFNNPIALNWDFRSKLLLKEFVEFNADVMCLQEVQESHLKPFYNKLNELGYTGFFKQRTGNKSDGVAIYFKNSTFQLVDYTTVEYYQPGVSVLNRDNVGLIVKVAPKEKPDERVVFATTHLLYNPRRHDVKLAQVQILLAEVERFAFREIDGRTMSSKYWPVILTGDMNFEPGSGGFQLLNMGCFRFEGLSSKTLTREFYNYGQILGKELIPKYLGVTDSCQHWNVVLQRNTQTSIDTVTKSKDDHKNEIKLLQIYNSDFKKEHTSSSNQPNLENEEKNKICSLLPVPQGGFGSGQISHTLQLTSVYNHSVNECARKSQVSTFQDGWVVVDYIFYSQIWNPSVAERNEGNLRLVARLKLFSAEEASKLGPIPNLSSPSDHYPLAAKFALIF